MAVKLILFSLFWLAVIYLVNAAIARRFPKIKPLEALTYFCVVAMIGVFGEVFLDSVYDAVVGEPLWRYRILPVHDGYTSYFAPIIWGLYGFHIYLLHGTLRAKRVTKTWILALIISLEALLLEALLTLHAKVYLGEFLYYYYPSDLWHVTSIQNIPFYFLGGLVIVKTLRRARLDPRLFIPLSLATTFVLIFLT